MIHLCARCDAIVSDEANDYSLTDAGDPICEACEAEAMQGNWQNQQEQDDADLRRN